MTIIDEQVEATYVHVAHRAARRPPELIASVADRIRVLQRTEPMIVGDRRTSVLAELALLQLQLERLSLNTWRDDSNARQTIANAEALAEQVDRLALHWPHQAVATEGNIA
jgi:hypothetical protein